MLSSDITERRNVQAELKAAELRYRWVFDNAGAAIIETIDDGVPVAVNPAFAALLGYDSATQFLSEVSFIGDLFVDPDARRARLDGATKGDEVRNWETDWRRRDGGTIRVRILGRVPPAGRGRRRGVGVVVDATERTQVQAALQRLNETAAQVNEAKSEFLSRMSHELRTPLHAILGFAELLESEQLKGPQRAMLEQISASADHLLKLVNEALDISAIERGSLSLSLEPVHLGEVVNEALAMLRPLAARRSVTLPSPGAACDVHVQVDRQRLLQVMLNLLSNAVKYSREGAEIELHCAPDGTRGVRIEVADSGIGIAQADVAGVFEPFNRAGATGSEVEGTGLGLAIAKHLVEAMGGRIGLQSERGRGTRIWVALSAAVAPQTGAQPSERGPRSTAARSGASARAVVYIEDSATNVRLLEAMLAARPEITLLSAARGDLGLQLVREHHPALLLLDLNLPGISAEEVIRRVRGDPATAASPVVILSGDASPEQILRMRLAGADDYVTKPFTRGRLLSVVDRLGAGAIAGSSPA